MSLDALQLAALALRTALSSSVLAVSVSTTLLHWSLRLAGYDGEQGITRWCRYLGLSQTWRKFFCVLAPREKVAGYPLDMQLLIFSKNGFDPVTSLWVTDAAPIEIPLKAAHGRACYELVCLANTTLTSL